MSQPSTLPEFPASLHWFDRPPLAAATGLRGHVTAVLFWRLGCVHSRHALAELARLQAAREERPFVALAIHVPTVPAERSEARLRAVLAQLPEPLSCAVDASRATLAAFGGVTSLPTLVLADVDGSIAAVARGEPNRLRLAEAVEAMLARAERNATTASVPFAPCAARAPQRLVPQALAVDGDTLWLAAAGHRRVYALSAAGVVQRAVGDGRPGRLDGPPHAARFHTPVGLAVHRGHLLVADAGSHTLRAIDRASGDVATWCGTGDRSTDRFGGGFGDAQGLCSPAGLAVQDGAVYVCQAGAHQIWQFDPETQAASAWLGTGSRSHRDGGDEATFAEPWGIAAEAGALWIADAGNDALRCVDLGHNVTRTVAQGLLRPTAVVVHGGGVLVAASWQPAVLRLAADGTREVLFDGSHGLVEPVALAVAGAQLWIADAGADALFVADLALASPSLRRVDLQALPAPAAAEVFAGAASLAEPLALQEFSDATLRIVLPVEAGALVDAGAPCAVDVVDEGVPVLAIDRHAPAVVEDGQAVVLVPVGDRGSGVLRIRIEATVRSGPSAAPRAAVWRYVVPVEVCGSGLLTAEVRAAVTPART